MKFALLVLGSPLGSGGADSAWRFADAALQAGHKVPRVFFMHEGVYNANQLAAPAQDETDRLQRWQQLSREHDCELIVCAASTIRRGVLDADESKRQQKSAANLSEAFEIGGLGLLIEATSECDRVLSFGC